MTTAPLSPEALIADVDRRARRHESPCGDGVMVWRAWGQGPPLLLLHGAHGAWTHFIRNIETLAAGRRVIVPDMPGYGDSASMTGPETGEAYAEVVAQGLRRLVGAEAPVDVAAFSMGAMVGAHLAALAPDLVRRLVVINAGGLGTPMPPPVFTPLKGLAGEALRAGLAANLLAIMLHSPDKVDELALHLQATNPRRARSQVHHIVLPDGLLHILPRVTAQLDAIWGVHDRPHPDLPLHQAVLQRFDPGCEMRAVHDAGHWSMFENAPGFNAELIDLLAQPLRKPL